MLHMWGLNGAKYLISTPGGSFVYLVKVYVTADKNGIAIISWFRQGFMSLISCCSTPKQK